MNDFPRWKYVLIVVVILAGLLYALPNVFPQDAAVQVSANRGSVVDDALKERALGLLEKRKIVPKGTDLADKKLLLRVRDPDQQLVAAETLREGLGDQYVVALNSASTVPGWLRSVGAKAMTLGLDLRGGVHFLMEVDQKSGVVKQVERYRDDLRGFLRTQNIRYRSVTRTPEGIAMQLRSDADRDKAAAALPAEMPELELSDGAVSADGYTLLARVRPTAVQAEMDKSLEQNLATLRNRVDELHVAEPIIQRQGASRIVVQLPGVQDTAEAKKILGATATLEYRAVDTSVLNPMEAAATGRIPADSRLYYERRLGIDGKPIPVILKKRLIVSGDQLVDASSGFDQQNGEPMVSVVLNNAGARRMQDFTNANVGKGMAVVFIERTPEVRLIDGKEVRTTKVKEEVISIANVREPFGKRFQTTGLDSSEEASETALLLRAGSLSAPVDIVEERVVGPSLGQDNIAKGFRAVMIGLVAILIFVALYYKVFGLIADFALLLNLVLLVAILSMFGATLTMPGIAGIVLTLGMAIDANVLICERVREELRNGLTPLAAIRAGFDKAWATILDANVTHLIAAVGLMLFGSGPIFGFALTLAIGILTSMFTSVTVTHAIINLVFSGRRLKTLPV